MSRKKCEARVTCSLTRGPDEIRISRLQVQVRPKDYISQATLMALAWAIRPGVSESMVELHLALRSLRRAAGLYSSTGLWHYGTLVLQPLRVAAGLYHSTIFPNQLHSLLMHTTHML